MARARLKIATYGMAAVRNLNRTIIATYPRLLDTVQDATITRVAVQGDDLFLHQGNDAGVEALCLSRPRAQRNLGESVNGTVDVGQSGLRKLRGRRGSN